MRQLVCVCVCVCVCVWRYVFWERMQTRFGSLLVTRSREIIFGS